MKKPIEIHDGRLKNRWETVKRGFQPVRVSKTGFLAGEGKKRADLNRLARGYVRFLVVYIVAGSVLKCVGHP